MQVNIPAESGDMGVLANHVPSIEQLKPGLVEVIEESGGSKQFFCKSGSGDLIYGWLVDSEWRPCQKDKTNCTDKYDVGSVWRVRHCATRLSAQHQCRGRVSLGRLQLRRKYLQILDWFCTTLISSSS